MTDEPDAWDECAGCGHDREEHDRAGCLLCPSSSPFGCVGFVEEHDR